MWIVGGDDEAGLDDCDFEFTFHRADAGDKSFVSLGSSIELFMMGFKMKVEGEKLNSDLDLLILWYDLQDL